MKFLTKQTIMESSFVLAVAAILGLLVNQFHPKSVPIAFSRPPLEYAADTVLAEELPETSITVMQNKQAEITPLIVTTTQVIKLLSTEQAILLDARDKEDFLKTKIEGAQNLSFDDYDTFIIKIKTLPHDKWIICYCDGPQCDLSDSLAHELINVGFNKVAIYKEGLEGWSKSQKIIKVRENQSDAK